MIVTQNFIVKFISKFQKQIHEQTNLWTSYQYTNIIVNWIFHNLGRSKIMQKISMGIVIKNPTFRD